MGNYTITKKGAEWLANRIISNRNSEDIDTMYIVYTNSNISSINLNSNITIDDLFDEDRKIWCMKKKGGVVGYLSSDTDGNIIANVSCVVTSNDVVHGGSIELSADSSKIIAVAIAVSGDPDNIIAACNITKAGASTPVKWVDNMSMSVSCPVCICPYPADNTSSTEG